MEIKRMRTISILWGMVLVLAFSLLTVYGLIYKKNKQQKYAELESTLVTAGEGYMQKYSLYPEDGEYKVINLDILKYEELITEFKQSNNDCTGFVVIRTISSTDEEYEYEGYISCPSYKTEGYDDF